MIQGGILLNIIVIAQLLKQDYTTVKKNTVTSIPLLPLPPNPAPRQLLRVQQSSPRHSPQRSPRIYRKNIHVQSYGNGNSVSIHRLNKTSRRFNRFTHKLYGITGCGPSTCTFDVLLFVGCTLVLVGHLSSVAMLTLRASSFGIDSNQVSVLLPLYSALGVACRFVHCFYNDKVKFI